MQLVHNAAMAPMYVCAVREALRDGVPTGNAPCAESVSLNHEYTQSIAVRMQWLTMCPLHALAAETKTLAVSQPPRRPSAVDFQWAADDRCALLWAASVHPDAQYAETLPAHSPADP